MLIYVTIVVTKVVTALEGEDKKNEYAKIIL